MNPKHTFANFVVGPSNQLAHAAAVAAAGGAGRRYNPLIICGGTGLGKTHLVHAIAHRVHAERPVPTGRGWQIRVDTTTPSRELVLLVPERFGDRRLDAPAEGPTIELYGWRYRGLPLKGAPLAADLIYA